MLTHEKTNQILDFLNMKKSPFAHYYVLFAFFWGGFARFLLATCKNISCNTCFLPALGFLEHALQPAPPAPPLEFNEFTICWVVAMLGYLTTSCQVSQMTNDSLRQISSCADVAQVHDAFQLAFCLLMFHEVLIEHIETYRVT